MLAIIGGTGLYQMNELEVVDQLQLTTPFGLPSGPVVRGRLGDKDVLFLARHGEGHRLLPHEVNYRANIFALKSQGATQVIGVSAVGSLREHLAPGDLVLPHQYFDWTRGRRAGTFFGEGISAHISTANPVSANLSSWIERHAKQLGYPVHAGLTYACVEGPRLGTRAESHFLRQAGCDLVGMTNVPEVFLAREAQICYATIGIVTDYDCWMEDPSHHASVDTVIARYGTSLDKARQLLVHLVQDHLPEEEADIRVALSRAMLTPRNGLTEGQRSWIDVLAT